MEAKDTIPDIAPTKTAALDLRAAERAGIYRWLSGIFAREPTVDALRIYGSVDGRALLDELGDIPALAPAAEAMHALVSDSTDAGLKTTALDLSGEFARLFLGVGGRRSAPPYQSFYVGAEGRLMQHTVSTMQIELKQLGARLAEGFPDLPDHIAVQLAVMGELVQTAGPVKQADYLKHRLLNWTDEFRDRCAAACPSGFYAAAASALVDFVRTDAASLES